MKRFVEGVDRGQSTLLPECLEDCVVEDNPVRVIDVFVQKLGLAELGFERVDPKAAGRPSYHPSVLLKLYIYGYLNRVQMKHVVQAILGTQKKGLGGQPARRAFSDHASEPKVGGGLKKRRVALWHAKVRSQFPGVVRPCIPQALDGEAGAR